MSRPWRQRLALGILVLALIPRGFADDRRGGDEQAPSPTSETAIATETPTVNETPNPSEESAIANSTEAARRFDASKVLGHQACSECHAQELEVWQATEHAKSFDQWSKSDRAQTIAKRLGIASVADDTSCVGCHATPHEVEGKWVPLSGISCEQCHGPARDWIATHADYAFGQGVDASAEIEVETSAEAEVDGDDAEVGDDEDEGEEKGNDEGETRVVPASSKDEGVSPPLEEPYFPELAGDEGGDEGREPANEGKSATKDRETPEGRRRRIEESVRQGMRNPVNAYLMARICFNCHAILDERLVNVGEHAAASEAFELVAWSQGTMRHNFLRGDGHRNVSNPPERLRVLYVVGLMTDLEYSLRATAGSTERGTFGFVVAKRAYELRRRLADLQEKIQNPFVDQALVAAYGVKLKTNNSEALEEAADAVGKAAYEFAEATDGHDLSAIDDALPLR